MRLAIFTYHAILFALVFYLGLKVTTLEEIQVTQSKIQESQSRTIESAVHLLSESTKTVHGVAKIVYQLALEAGWKDNVDPD